jgi:hypothetical protein
VTTPAVRDLFADPAPAALLADLATVADLLRLDVRTGRCSPADAAYTLDAAWYLLARLVAAATPHPSTPSC